MKRINQATTIEDLMREPNAYGIPTLQQFQMNRERYMGRPDDSMACLSNGPQMLRKRLRRVKFQVHYVDVSEGQVDRILGDHGYSMEDFDITNPNGKLKFKLELIPVDANGGKLDAVVNFMP